MSETPLYSAPSHALVPSVVSETAVISNGNHLVISTQETTNTTSGINIFSQCQKRIYSKSAPVMGCNESKPPSDSKLNALFEQYKDEMEDAILAEGIEQLCKDLQVRKLFLFGKSKNKRFSVATKLLNLLRHE